MSHNMTKEEKLKKLNFVYEHLTKAYEGMYEALKDEPRDPFNTERRDRVGYIANCFSDIFHELEFYEDEFKKRD